MSDSVNTPKGERTEEINSSVGFSTPELTSPSELSPIDGSSPTGDFPVKEDVTTIPNESSKVKSQGSTEKKDREDNKVQEEDTKNTQIPLENSAVKAGWVAFGAPIALLFIIGLVIWAVYRFVVSRNGEKEELSS